LTVQEREREEARQRQAEREAQQVEPQFARWFGEFLQEPQPFDFRITTTMP
jgi:hypothetical protein